ncbi:MAG TPA: hypothetical protein VFE50_23000 [Cyclobacteriaceae bacterium]|nr:hypothetical protein [Cyclobacteriaceae bacterium]
MKLWDTILLSLTAAFLVIGIYEVVTQDLSFAYPFLMLAIIFFFWFTYRKRR